MLRESQRLRGFVFVVAFLVTLISAAGTLKRGVAFWSSLGYAVANLFVMGVTASNSQGIIRASAPGAVFTGLGAVVIAAEASIH